MGLYEKAGSSIEEQIEYEFWWRKEKLSNAVFRGNWESGQFNGGIAGL